ncbi:MAG: gliding motility lipoprotein GldD [Bacteroidetes bacterium]|nr:MAG: gliding motility lipoprotein GldD [Bacteroidota bacterium]
MDPDGCLFLILLEDTFSYLQPEFNFSLDFLIELFVLAILLLASAFVSAAETAFFGITPAELIGLKSQKSTSSKLVQKLLETPKRLLATLLISVNFVNIGIVVISSLMISQVFDFSRNELLGFLIQVVAVTFVIVLFCEVMPKVWATQNAVRYSIVSAIPVFVLDKICRPFSALLVNSTALVDKRVQQKGYDVSVDELTHAIEITSDKNTPEDEKKILKGIAKFGNIDVRQIMKPRMDVIAFDQDSKFSDILPLIVENKYSRVPVFEDSFDKVTGVLYIKDLLPYLDKENDDAFDWLKLKRPAYFVPESKKINDLLQEFQEKKIHLAIVIDEYGGSSGIVTLEDILEEIVGEINDEFDEEELFYSKLDENTYVFEGKTLLNDLCRVTELDRRVFETDSEAQSDTLAGFLLELKGMLPQKNEQIQHRNISFLVESVDRKRIKRVKITIHPEKEEEPKQFTGKGLLKILLPILLVSSLYSCDESYIPKPKGYFRIDMPEKEYRQYSNPECAYSFESPAYSIVSADTGRLSEPCWLNVEYPQFRATLYISHKKVDNNLSKFLQDSHELSMKHISKASGIEEEDISRPDERVFGSLYRIKGSTASALQFHLTDSSSHFVRGSLYFYAVPNPDSLAPVLKFLESDIRHMIETFRWN